MEETTRPVGHNRRAVCSRGHNFAETRRFRSDGGTYCAVCRSERSKESYHRDKSYYKRAGRQNHLKRRYGLSVEDFDRMLAEQKNSCPICNRFLQAKADKGTSWFPVVDHDHVTGKVRGILCNGCNTGIGLMGEDPARFTAAVAYLTKHK